MKRGGSSCLGDALSDAADYGYCASHSRWFWGFRLHTLMAPDGTLRAMALTSPKEGEREVCLRLLGRVNRSGPITVLGDKGYAGADFEADAAELGATIVRPRRKDETGHALHLAPLRQRIESIYWTAKDILGLEPTGPAPCGACGADRRPLPGARRGGLAEPRTRTSVAGAGRLRDLSRGTTHLAAVGSSTRQGRRRPRRELVRRGESRPSRLRPPHRCRAPGAGRRTGRDAPRREPLGRHKTSR